MTERNICIVLTCTIDVCGVAFTERSDIETRHKDYQIALRKWLKNRYVGRIVVVENSGYDLAALKQIVAEEKSGKQVEFISFFGQDFPRHLGKGYGEAQALARVASDSRLLGSSGSFIKINGRYYVPNAHRFLEQLNPDVDVMTNLSKGLTWSDSRVFGGSSKFLKDYLCPEGRRVDDSASFFFEHALACATHRAIADGLNWVLLPCTPHIDGMSGTANSLYKQSWLRTVARDIFLRVKAAIIFR
ncbi:MAG TPA: hypothetical protein VIU46_01005 [Gallionellaceae bacterium]